jgi:flavin reductase (DIM6/NTAB) family NADH-FMN oxidoreductase RutF
MIEAGAVAVDAERFKQALAGWATGVTIVTACDGDRIHGMTVSAFSAVSLEPPLVLICADESSHTHPVIAGGKVFAVNILARGQSELSNRFASKKHEHVRFEGLDYDTGATGSPLIAGCVASLDCRVVAAHEHGDHLVYIGEVVDLRLSDREPLLYHRSAYGTFSPKRGRF